MRTPSNKLAAAIARQTPDEGIYATEVPGLTLHRWHRPTQPANLVYEPRICVVAQGAKRVVLGEETYVYDAKHYLISSVHLPAVAQITTATKEHPFLALTLDLDMEVLTQLMVDSRLPKAKIHNAGSGMATADLGEALSSAFQRLVELNRDNQDIPILAPIILKEIHYRLLVGDQGQRLRQIAATGSRGHEIALAIAWLNEHYKSPLKISELASRARMSVSTFHQHFRMITTMTPLQFQKWLRLNEARRLMLSGAVDAGTAAFQVGYASPSQFSREYSRLFGAPPLKDVSQLRTAA